MVSAIDKYIIEKVKERRMELGVTQNELAYELNMSNGFIGMVESGKYGKKYNTAHLNDLAKILKCSPRYFLPEEAL